MSIADGKALLTTAESCVYPENLLHGPSDELAQRRWWLVYTKARQEKALARSLFAYEIPFYLPLVKKTSVYRRNRVTTHIPVFAGYVFMYGSEEERVSSLTTNRISRILPVHDPDRLRRDLCDLSKLIASDSPLTVESRMVPGHRIRVRHGTLAGLEGTVLTRRGKTRLLVCVNFLQQGASVEIEDYMLERID